MATPAAPAAAEGDAPAPPPAPVDGEQEAALDALLSELEGLPLRLQERHLLQRELSRRRWMLSRRGRLVSLLEGRPADTELRALTDEARALGLAELPEVREAMARLAKANEWRARASAALGRETNVAHLRELLALSASVPCVVAEMQTVQERIEGTAGWKRRATDALGRTATLEEVTKLLTQAEDAAVPVADRAALLEAHQVAQWWRARASVAFVKNGCALTLAEALRGDGQYELAMPDGSWAPTLGCSYCTGEDASETAQYMIGCDRCDFWYHGPCVGVGKTQADNLEDYTCPACARKAGTPYAFGPPTPLPKKTRRPRLKFATALVAEAAEVGIEVGEAALVTEIARGAEEWEQATAGLTEGDDALAKMTEALPGTIERAQQLEARPDLISQMKQTLGRVRGWVAAARSVLEPPSAKKAANTATTAAARDLVEGLRLQAARLPLPPTLSGQLSSAIERDQKWRADARKLLRAGAAEPRTSLQKLVDAPGAPRRPSSSS